MNDYMERPSVVTAAAVLLYIFAGLGVLAGLVGFLATATVAPGAGLLSLVVIGLSVVYIVAATKIMQGSNNARITTIVLLSISIVLNVVDYDSRSLITIGLALLVIGLLSWNRDAQAYFRANA
jgi:hypothetical protein